MDYIGKIIHISRDLESKGILVTLLLADVSVQELQALKGLEKLSVVLRQYRKKRSLDANAYYWKLLGKLSEAMKLSKPRTHNLMLRRYGQREELDEKPVLVTVPDTEEAEKAALEAETYHIRPTLQTLTGHDGVVYRTYVMLRGSSTYNTQEMSLLIDGLVSECKDLGIETLPTDELERMMSAYEEKGNRNRIH